MKSGKLMLGLFSVVLIMSFVMAAGDVAYVVDDYNKSDAVYLNALDDADLDADIITDDMIKSTDFSMYNFILVGDGILKNAKYIPDMPMILVNPKHANHFGFLKGGRVKSLASSSNLMVDAMGVVQVYDSPSVKLGGPALTYNYLPQKFMEDGVVSFASTVTKDKSKMGSVIAFNENKESCFFGISETKFWNDNSLDLFNECLKFVSGVHDVRINEGTENSVNGIRIKDIALDQYLLSSVSELKCGIQYRIDFVTENVGDFVEDVKFFSKLGVVNWTATKTGLNPGSTTTTGSKTINITNEKFDNQAYTLEVTANIDNDNNVLDNSRMRNVMVTGC